MSPLTPRLPFAHIVLRGEFLQLKLLEAVVVLSRGAGEGLGKVKMGMIEEVAFIRGQGLCTTLMGLDVGPGERWMPEELG